MIGGGGDGGGRDEAERRWQGLREILPPTPHERSLLARKREGERRCSLPLTYQLHTKLKLITFHTKQRFGTDER